MSQRNHLMAKTTALFLAVVMFLSGLAPLGEIPQALSFAETTSITPVQSVNITSVTIEGATTEGQTLTAVVQGEGGQEPTNVTYQWKKYEHGFTGEYDEEDQEIWDYIPSDIIDANEKTLLLTYELVDKMIAVEVKNELGSKTSAKTAKVKELANPTRTYLKSLTKGLSLALNPKFGVDTNAVDFVKGLLDKKHASDSKYTGVTLRLTASTLPDTIGLDGIIHYFYKPVAEVNSPSHIFLQPVLTFELSKDGQSYSFDKKINVRWDLDKLKKDIQENSLNTITEEMVKGTNASLDAFADPVELSQVLPPKNRIKVEWKTDRPDVLGIKTKQGKSYEPKTYIITPKQVVEDTPVKLIAQVTDYTFAGADDAKEAVKTLSREFSLVVKGQGGTLQEQIAQLQATLDKNLTAELFKDVATKEAVNPTEVVRDFNIPAARALGLDKSKDYRVEVQSSNSKHVEINGLRANVVRPLHESKAEVVTLTYVVSEKDNSSVRAEKRVEFTVLPLGATDLADAKALMERVKAAYFEGIKGANTDKQNITQNLHSFREAYIASGDSEIQWIYHIDNDKNLGIVPVDLPGYDPMGSAQWRLFRSSRPDVISHENLLVTQPVHDTEVEIESALTHYAYRNYLKAYPDNADIKALLSQPVSTTVLVKGKNGTNPNPGDTVKEASVEIRFYDGENKTMLLPMGTHTVKSGTAKSFGYTSADVLKHAFEGNVTALDVLVHFTAIKVGATDPSVAGAKEKVRDDLDVGEAGFVSKVDGRAVAKHPFAFFVNDRQPSDKVYNPKYGAYTGYLIDNSVVAADDVVAFFFHQKGDYSDSFAWFEQSNQAAKTLTIPKDEQFSVTLKGFPSMNGLSTDEVIRRSTKALGNVQLCLLNKETGVLTPIDGKKTSPTGTVTLAFEQPGEYLLSAVGSEELGLIAPILKITVTDGLSSEERQKVVDADAAALSFGDLKLENKLNTAVQSNLNLISVGKSGKTKIRWASNAPDVIGTDGVVRRPLAEAGDKEVELTATVSYGDVSKTKVIRVTVLKLPSAADELDSIVKKLPATIHAEEYAKNKVDKKDTNIIEVVRQKVQEISPAANVENLCVPASDLTQIAPDGTITYGEKMVYGKVVAFQIVLGGVKKEYAPKVTIPAKAVTKAEALAGEWLKLEDYKGKNPDLDHITKHFELPSEVGDKYKVNLEWKSSHSAVSISTTATNKKHVVTIKRPSAGEPDTVVELTCTIKPGTYWKYGMAPIGPMPNPSYGTRVFTIRITAPTQEEEGQARKLLEEAIQLYDLSVMTVRGTKEPADLQNITYHMNNHPLNWNYVQKKPGFKKEFREIQVEWKSENPGILKLFSAVDIVRTDVDQVGDIVLTLSYDGVSVEKRWPTTVKAFTAESAKAENEQLKRIADVITFDLIKDKNTSVLDVTKNLAWFEGCLIKNGELTFEKIKKDIFHQDGAMLTWSSSHPELIKEKIYPHSLEIVRRPLKNTKVTLTVVLSSIKFATAKGVKTYTKKIDVIVPGTNDVPPTEDLLHPIVDTTYDEVREAAKSIVAHYRAKDQDWWAKNGTFWQVVGVAAYGKDIDGSGIGLSEAILRKVVDAHIKEKIEGITGNKEKASSDANMLANGINALSALGFDATKVTKSDKQTVDARALLEAIRIEDAKKGWFKTIAPYAMKALKQNGIAPANEAEYVAYLVSELQAEKYNFGVDTPAMMIQGLAPYYAQPEVKKAVDKALDAISKKQSKTGSFGNANADAMVIVALAQLGIDPHTDARFVKDGKSLVNGLMQYRLASEAGFYFGDATRYNELATYQAFLALISSIKVHDSVVGGAQPDAYDVFDFSSVEKKPAVYVGVGADQGGGGDNSGGGSGSGDQGGGSGDQGGGTQPKEETIRVKFRLIGAPKNDGRVKTYVTWIATRTLTLEKDATVYDAFTQALDAAGLSYRGASSNYVSSIEAPRGYGGYWLGEFDNGQNSGWMYTVNGDHPQVGLKDKKLVDGDNVVWHYVYDYVTEEHTGVWLGAADINPPTDHIVDMDETDNAASGTDTDSKKSGGKDAEKSKAGTKDAAKESGDSAKDVVAKASDGTIVITSQVGFEAKEVGAGGIATVRVNAETIAAQIRKMDEKAKQTQNARKGSAETAKKPPLKEMQIEVASDKNAKTVQVVLPSQTLGELKTAVDRLTIHTNTGSIALDSKALAELAKKGKQNLTVSLSEKNDMSDKIGVLVSKEMSERIQNEGLLDRPWFEIEMKVGEIAVAEVEGRVEVQLPYTLTKSEMPEAVVAYQIKKDGSTEILRDAMLSEAGAFLVKGLVSGTCAIGYRPVEYADTGRHWAEKDIRFLAARGVVNGKGNGTFDPDAVVTRAEFVQMLANLSGDDLSNQAADQSGTGFGDVPSDAWYGRAVAWASANGITQGTGGGNFSPNAQITRQDMVVMLERHAKRAKDALPTDDQRVSYADALQVSGYAREAVEHFTNAGIVGGSKDAEERINFRPTAEASRAEAVRMMTNYMKKK